MRDSSPFQNGGQHKHRVNAGLACTFAKVVFQNSACDGVFFTPGLTKPVVSGISFSGSVVRLLF